MKETIETIALYVLCLGVLLIVAFAFHRRDVNRREYSAKCFEQTRNEMCWGIDLYGFARQEKGKK